MNNKKMRNSPKRDAFPIEVDGFSISYMIRLCFLPFDISNWWWVFFMGLSGNVSIVLPPSCDRPDVIVAVRGPSPKPLALSHNCNVFFFDEEPSLEFHFNPLFSRALSKALVKRARNTFPSSVCTRLNPLYSNEILSTVIHYAFWYPKNERSSQKKKAFHQHNETWFISVSQSLVLRASVVCYFFFGDFIHHESLFQEVLSIFE